MNKSRSEALLVRRRNAVANGVGLFNTATVQSAKDATIIDVDGNELIDFSGGIGVVNAGHCPQPVIDAIVAQAQKYIHTSFNVVTYEPYISLCEKLNSLFPHGGKAKTMLVNTGAEAVENAVKIAKQATGRSAVICYSGAFHGRTLMAMTLTSKTAYGKGCGPFAPEVYRIDYPDFYKKGGNKTVAEFVKFELSKLQEFFRTHVRQEDVAAIIIELVQGEGGFNVAPKDYITGLREICDSYGIMLIFDEVQTGFGRTAAWGAVEHFDVQPDISTWAKSLGSGLPIGAVIGRQEVMDAAAAGTIGGTYIGNPLACAASLATIKYMEDINLNEKAKLVGSIIRNRFEALKARHSTIGDVRGLGAMIAMEFVKDNDPLQPDGGLCASLVEACAERGLIVISAGIHKNVLRVLVPLVISEALLNKGLDIISEELEKITA